MSALFQGAEFILMVRRLTEVERIRLVLLVILKLPLRKDLGMTLARLVKRGEM